MGVFDDVEASRPNSPSYPVMTRGFGEARRKVVLLVLLGCFLVLTLVAFRRQDQIADIIEDQRSQWSNTTASLTKSESHKEEADGEKPSQGPHKHAEKPPKSHSKTTVAKGPTLGNGDRSLADSNLVALRNETLGVCSTPDLF